MEYRFQKKEAMTSSETGKNIIKKEIPLIAKLPGVYKMLGEKNEVLYVGKAKNLPNRLKSYVSEKNHIIRTERMLAKTKKLEITTTSNESEALLLEANLIKKHKPRFNILLRDDKSFPFIFIGTKDNWPQIKKHRGKKNKEGFFFGPFASAGSANWTIKMIQKIFQLRICDDTVFKNRERPCILYQIKRCSGPCVNFIDKEDYKKSVDDAIADLELIAGQKPIKTFARKSVASFKIREGFPIGCKVTLRGNRMYEFLDRLLSIAIPRERDFRGLNPKSFDGQGNYSLGIKEHIIFPEIDYDKVEKIRGMDICITTSANNDKEGFALLSKLNFPFKS